MKKKYIIPSERIINLGATGMLLADSTPRLKSGGTGVNSGNSGEFEVLTKEEQGWASGW